MNSSLYPNPLLTRLRRNRKNASVRALVSETTLSASDLVYPIFLMEGNNTEEPIHSMPGISRKTIDLFLEELKEIVNLGIRAIAPFPVVPESKKDSKATGSYDPEGLIPECIRQIKEAFPELLIMTDVALDPYNTDGHDGLVSDSGEILNDQTVEVLCKMALCHAEAGADFVCPSDMMDGRVGAIRKALDQAGYTSTSIMAYSAKYASAFYGPFRDALHSAPKAGDKKTYQMDPANRLEALREVESDIAEGADIVMVKPAGPYLDIISEVHSRFPIPVAAYQVSGEYSMIVSAAQNGFIDRSSTILESLMGIKRAGASLIWTYFAKEAAMLLNNKGNQ